jgi:hypothetical protein
VNVRPSTGATPSTVKKLAVTRRPMTCSGVPSDVRAAVALRVAAMSENTRLRSFQLK